jgi:hypothetical protein
LTSSANAREEFQKQFLQQREQVNQVEINIRLQQIAFGWVHAENQEELTADSIM